jgi:hypothetical protein
VGAGALGANTTANSNTGVGENALSNLTTGAGNTAVGGACMDQGVVTGNYNIGVGHLAARYVTSGYDNVVVGYTAFDAATTANGNTAIGKDAMTATTSGATNVAVGKLALGAHTTGTSNTCVGYAAGDVLTTGNTNVCIGGITDPSANNASEQIIIGYNATCVANTTATFGMGSNTASLGLDGSDTSWAAASDVRLKDNIENAEAGLDFINELRPITYKWKAKKDVPHDMPEYDDGSDEPCKGTGKTNHGFIAQEVKAVIDKYDSIKDGHNIWQEADSGTQTVAPSALVPMLVKALQELSAKVEELEDKLNKE